MDQEKRTAEEERNSSAEGGLYFAYSAMLRIMGEGLDFGDISSSLGIEPTHSHRKGDSRKGSRTGPWKQDMWSLTADISEEKPLYEHIDALWDVVKPSLKYLRKLKESADVDIFLGYRSNCDTAGVEVPWSSLNVFVELEVPFSLSVIIA